MCSRHYYKGRSMTTNVGVPGYRFYPTEEELVSFYLRNQLEGAGERLRRVVPVVDIYSMEPCQLPQHAGELCRGDKEQWFFFSARQEREANGGRPCRTTGSGYWKATGSPDYVYSSDNKVIGLKKTMVFYKGRAPTGRKTKWKMNEYRAIQINDQSNTHIPTLRHEFSLCRVYVVSGSSRAFDRRPFEKTTSSGSSCSREDGIVPLEIARNSNSEMVIDQEPMWEWEQFNWLS